jgi:hypothetical protein
VALPHGFEPAALASGPGESVIVVADGGADGRRVPRAVRLDGGAATELRVAPASYYGRRTVWHGLATAGDTVYAFGGRSGGAHGSTRWTTWAGTAEAPGLLREDVQTFETFGGPAAGGLSAVVAPPNGPPLLLGSRVGDGGSGLDVALWHYRDRRWIRRPSAGTSLAATPDQQPAAHGMTTRGAGLVIAGSVTTFADGVRTRPAVWTSPGTDGPWTQQMLPAAKDQLGEAQAAACDRDGSCLVTGYVGDRLAAWAVSVAGDVSSVAVPDVATDGAPALLAHRDAEGWAIAVPDASSGRSRVLVQDGARWRELDGPPGTVSGFVVADGSMWLSTGAADAAGLWRAPAS